jgi:hypothetical protein
VNEFILFGVFVVPCVKGVGEVFVVYIYIYILADSCYRLLDVFIISSYVDEFFRGAPGIAWGGEAQPAGGLSP